MPICVPRRRRLKFVRRTPLSFPFWLWLCRGAGQMDSYVRMFDDKYITEGDNPTIGLILCARKNETIARYSVLNDSQQIFASKYMLYLPTEEELVQELDRERKLIEAQKD